VNKIVEIADQEKRKRPPIWRRPRYRAVQRLQRMVFGRVLLDRAGDQRGTTWVVGGSRSGTTWIAEVLNHRNEYRYMWEPVTPRRVPMFARFLKGQYLRPDNQEPRYREPLTALITGQIRHPWVDHLNCNPAASRRLIKDVYANLFAHWVNVNLPGIHTIFVIRHPLAVMTSRMDTAPVRIHGEFLPDLDRYLQQDDLLEDFLAPYEGVIRASRTPLEQYALWWCIESFVPLRQFEASQVHVLCYERLRWQPEQELPRLAAFLGREFDHRLLAKLQRPSRTAGFDGSLERGVDPATAWIRRWSHDDVRRAMRIVSMFGLDEIYTDDPTPRPGGVEAFMRKPCASAQPA